MSKPSKNPETPKKSPPKEQPTGILVLASGEVFYGTGAGWAGEALGEVCFNTAMTGYQEILCDPSYSDQIVLFTFPHIGNVGTNSDDEEAASFSGGTARRSAARGAIFREKITPASNYRSEDGLQDWLEARKIVAVSGLDTRALTAHIRTHGMPHGILAHNPTGDFDIEALRAKVRGWQGLVGADLAGPASTGKTYAWRQALWRRGDGFGQAPQDGKTVVVIDYGVKSNILRLLAAQGLKVIVVPADMGADDILALSPDGIVLANGPGDPAATGVYAIPVIRELIAHEIPVLGICLGHQMLALALGAKTIKMEQGHHGANHPVMDYETGKVEIVSMNHGFAVDGGSLPEGVIETHKSLFDGSNCGLKLEGRPVFSVQHHPEASPGPRDSFYIFERFADML